MDKAPERTRGAPARSTLALLRLRAVRIGFAVAFCCAGLAGASVTGFAQSTQAQSEPPSESTPTEGDTERAHPADDQTELQDQINALGATANINDNVAPVTPRSTTNSACPWPTGKISVHMVDAEVYSALTFGTSDTFTSLADMLKQLKDKVAPHYDPTGQCGRCIEQLDVWGHGDVGGGYISFGPDDAQIGDKVMGANVDENLAAIGALMCVGGKVVIDQCNAGSGNQGTKALQALADKIGVPVSGPTGSIKACRIFGGSFTEYKEAKPGPNAKTPAQNKAGSVATGPI